jgi:hypothetical protein
MKRYVFGVPTNCPSDILVCKRHLSSLIDIWLRSNQAGRNHSQGLPTRCPETWPTEAVLVVADQINVPRIICTKEHFVPAGSPAETQIGGNASLMEQSIEQGIARRLLRAGHSVEEKLSIK